MLEAVRSQEKIDHLKGEKEPPKYDAYKLKEWQAADFIVFSWLMRIYILQLVEHFAFESIYIK